MAHLDHQKGYDEFKERVLEGIKQHFPLKGGLQTLELENLDVADHDYDPDAIRDQHKAKVGGVTWAAPVYGTFVLKDNKTGDVVDKRRMRLADLPLITRRYSHIIDGKEYQVNNQWQLKPGIYAKRRENGELWAAVNTQTRRSFGITFAPESKLFMMERGGSKIPVYPLLKQLGVDDDSLEHSWGKEVFSANKSAKGGDTAVQRFFRVDKKRQPKDGAEAEKYLVDTLAASALRPDATKLTLGKEFKNVTGESIHLATNKLLKIQSGAPEDDRDSILFKDLRSVGDFAYDYLSHYETKKSIRDKIIRKMFSAKDVRDVIKFDMFNDPLRRTFHENSEAELAKQINPVEMLGLAQQTTVLGPGGIQSQDAFDNMSNAKFVNPSTLGFLDPVRTPENEKSGGILRMPMGVQKHGKEPALQLYNLKTGKTELVTPVQFHNSVVVLPDQARWKDGKPTPIANKVKASSLDDTMKEVHWKDADYVMRHPSQLFSATTNLIPFLGNNSGNRATYAGQHIEQAISLKHRMAPLVQVATPSEKKGESTFEELVGGFAAHVSPVAGTVKEVKKDGIIVKQHDGKEHEIQLYNNFPLNDPKAMLHSTPLVKVGDKVSVGQTVADSNYTKNGALALGTNVRVAYIPYKGLNFEDGLVISKSAAAKFTSEHLHKPDVSIEKDSILDPKKFIVIHPDAFNQAQYKKLDDRGVVRVGQKVKQGDPLVLSMRPYQAKDRMSLQAIGRALSGRHVDTSLRWSSDHEGEVVGVHHDKDKITVHISTAEPMQVGDKISNRHGGKGICVAIVDDDKMPKTKDGRHIEVAFNPTSVPGRMNLGQILETAASKVAEKTGKPFIVHNFSNEPQLDRVKAELKKHGLTDQEELTDPETGMKLGKALVGPQHMFKLVHQIDKKESARSGMAVPGSEPESYDSNLMPASGGHTGGQSLGALDMYVLLAHGAKATIREVQTYKSEGPDPNPNPAKQWPSQHHDVWNAIQQGEPIPAPKSTFAWQKFTDMLKASGVDIQKRGHTLQLVPLIDSQILKMSHGEIKKPGEVVYPSLDKNGEPRPKTGGILDEKITGGHGGKGWSHIALAEPVPNPVFERAIQKLTGLTENQYMEVVHGQKAVTHSGAIVPLGTANAATGGVGMVKLLEKIDVDKDLKEAEKKLTGLKLPTNFAHRSTVPAVDNLVRKVKYLRALKEAGLKPTEAYVLHNLPVIPPIMRPISMLKDGSVKWGDLNELYKSFGAINTAMKDPSQAKLEDDQRQDLRQSLYDGVRAIIGVGTPQKDQKHKGILQQIAGDPAKEGYFQDTLMARRQDMSMRSTIVPNPSLGLDEVGLPREKALTLYKPFVVRKLVEMGAADHALEARKLIQDNDPSVVRALDLVAQERPVLLKRDPALHRHSIQGFRPKIVTGKAIQIHPLVTSGFSADFDGDTMSVYVPVSSQAVEEAKKMMPSQNLYNEASGRVTYTPTLESALGLYKMSRVTHAGTHKFSTAVEAIKAVNAGKLTINDLATIDGTSTTVGRVLLANALPEAMQQEYLTKHDKLIDKKGLDQLFTTIAKNHREEYGSIANKLKDLGNGTSSGAIPIFSGLKGELLIKAAESKGLQYVSTPVHSLSLEDFTPDTHTRDRVLGAAQKEVNAIDASLSIPTKDKERRAVDVWIAASNRMDTEHLKHIDKDPSNLAMMLRAGVKPSLTQYKQMVLAPVLMADATGKPIAIPITKSYSEGLDVASYWTQQQGARRGTVMKVQEVREPGTLSKRMVQTTMGLVVAQDDCGTQRGISLPVSSRDIQDRVLVHDASIKDVHVSAGTQLTPALVDQIRAADKGATLVVRSPLKCEHAKGLCSKCAGLRSDGRPYELGTNVGILAAQALGERSVQLTMKQFHSGGVVQSNAGNRAVDDFARVEQLMQLTESIPHESTLAMRSGKIEKVEKDRTGAEVWIGGVRHHVGKDTQGMALHEDLPTASKTPGYTPWQPPHVGMHVEAGQTLSDPNRTVVNPRDLYRATNNMERVQNYLVDELHRVYGSDVRRQHVETLVHAMGNLTKIRHPGDNDTVLIGEFRPVNQIRAMNRELIKQGKQPIEHSPVLKGVDAMPLQVQEDWLAKLQHIKLRGTLLEAASVGATSDLHGLHPVPSMAVGSEFGLNATHSKQPGLGHLKDVSPFNY